MSLIYYCETLDRKDLVVKTLEIFRDQLESAKTIFVKPKVVPSEPYPTTTHPDVLDAHLPFRTVILKPKHGTIF